MPYLFAVWLIVLGSFVVSSFCLFGRFHSCLVSQTGTLFRSMENTRVCMNGSQPVEQQLIRSSKRAGLSKLSRVDLESKQQGFFLSYLQVSLRHSWKQQLALMGFDVRSTIVPPAYTASPSRPALASNRLPVVPVLFFCLPCL